MGTEGKYGLTDGRGPARTNRGCGCREGGRGRAHWTDGRTNERTNGRSLTIASLSDGGSFHDMSIGTAFSSCQRGTLRVEGRRASSEEKFCEQACFIVSEFIEFFLHGFLFRDSRSLH